MMTELTANLAEPCYSVRDFLVLVSEARHARKPLDEIADALLDMVADA